MLRALLLLDLIIILAKMGLKDAWEGQYKILLFLHFYLDNFMSIHIPPDTLIVWLQSLIKYLQDLMIVIT